MRWDMHVHSLPVSRCSKFQPEEVPVKLKEAGVDNFVLCNHYYPGHLNWVGETLPQQVEAFIDCYNKVKEASEKLGMTAIFGAEVRLINVENAPEFLLYGITFEHMREYLPLYEYTQEDLFEYCNKRNILMYQAHPYRIEQGHKPANPEFVHGIEVFNGHFNFNPKYETCVELADSNGLFHSAGSDFHDPEDAGLGGIIIPDDFIISDSLDLRDFLLKNPKPKIYQNPCVM